MHGITSTLILATGLIAGVAAQQGHGSDTTDMGPVAFMWPEDRAWNAADDNVGPCGSKEFAGKRTDFPLVGGSIALNIADPAEDVVVRMAFKANPTSQSDFVDVITHIDDIIEGHQCYPIPTSAIPRDAEEGTKATIQLEYWSQEEGSKKKESFFACADITFVPASKMATSVPCFNVTSEEFATQEEVVLKNGGKTSGAAKVGAGLFLAAAGTLVAALF